MVHCVILKMTTGREENLYWRLKMKHYWSPFLFHKIKDCKPTYIICIVEKKKKKNYDFRFGTWQVTGGFL